ncbi:MAG: hypothetical protein RLZZ156_2507 [Deinococcota bacterium]|jgi:uncharacterized protein
MNLLEFRQEKDQFFKSRNSPLPASIRAVFTGLKYFDENPNLRQTATLEPDANQEAVLMQTSTGSERVYLRLGWVSFVVENLNSRLAVFVPEDQADSTELFIPFRDASSGLKTYGSGRYLEAQRSGNTISLDFNLAYNPYCAYSDGWSCPIPPLENWLSVPIEAGEMLLPQLEPVLSIVVGGDDD